LLKAIIILYFFNPKFFARAAHSIPELILLVYLTHGAQLKQEHAFSGVFTTFTPAVPKTTPPSQLGPLTLRCVMLRISLLPLVAEKKFLMAFFPLLVVALFKIGYSLLCCQVKKCNYK
jgi:hypothetical protein